MEYMQQQMDDLITAGELEEERYFEEIKQKVLLKGFKDSESEEMTKDLFRVARKNNHYNFKEQIELLLAII